MTPEPRYGSYEEAAIIGHVSVRTIGNWIEKGRIRAKRDGAARRKLIRLDDVERLVAEAAGETTTA
jgi:excisionase family DNA binding protein